MARFCPLFSGSKGNSTYIGSAKSGILVDAGMSAKRLRAALCDIGVEPDGIRAIFITHEHTDHIGALRVFAAAHDIDIYSMPGTLRSLRESGAVNEKNKTYELTECGVEIDGMHITPFRTSHDAAESVGYRVVTADGKSVSVATDTGIFTDKMVSAVYGSDLVMLESNHDIGMLRNSSYPYYTKLRILSDTGHLSNEVCASTATKLLEGGTTRFFLGHLSRENNVPVLAYQTTLSSMSEVGATQGSDYLLSVAAATNSSPVTVF